jgi:LysR family transcriptional regulator, glycine cleavage system transcriptional activator
MRRLPPLNSLKGFEAVVRLGNYNKAADELGVTHGAISRQVRVLEQYFGCRLFQPSGRQLVPTELARFFAAEAGAGLDRIAKATARVIEPAAARLVRVSGTPSFAMHWLMPRLGEFHRRHPTTEVSIAASRESLDNLVSSNDVILRRWPMQWDGFECRALFRDRRVLVCSSACAENVRSPEDVLGLTLLMCDGKNQAGAWENWMQHHGLTAPRVQKRIKFDHVFLLIEAVAQGLGVALLSEALMESHLRAGTLVRALPDDEMAYPNMYALIPEAASRSTSVRNFANWLVEQGEAVSGRLSEPDPFALEFDQGLHAAE